MKKLILISLIAFASIISKAQTPAAPLVNAEQPYGLCAIVCQCNTSPPCQSLSYFINGNLFLDGGYSLFPPSTSAVSYQPSLVSGQQFDVFIRYYLSSVPLSGSFIDSQVNHYTVPTGFNCNGQAPAPAAIQTLVKPKKK